MALMKSFLTLGFLLTAIILFPGCYTILLMEPDDDVSFNLYPPIYDSGSLPTPTPPPCIDCFLPPPTPPPVSPTIVIIHPPSIPPIQDIRRPIQTGRDPIASNPAPARNDENNHRDSGVQRGEQINSNPVPARNEESNRPTRDPETQRVRR